MAVSVTGSVSGLATGASAGTAICPGIGTVIGGIIGFIAGLFGGGSSTPKSTKLAGYAQAGLAIKQAELVAELKPYAIEEAKVTVEAVKEKAELEKFQTLALGIAQAYGAGQQAEVEAEATKSKFDWTPVLIGGGALGAALILRKR